MSEITNIYIDGEHAATITELQHDLPWHYGNIQPGDAFAELKESLEEATYSINKEGAVELVAGEDTVDRVSWGEDVDTSEMITKLTLAKYEEEGSWELEFTCEEENSEETAAA
ncbi:hypothetical protein OAU50_03705 [Planctomycetota bacterium]|nr:hypothetical protein [Planctomycetota bacterium]